MRGMDRHDVKKNLVFESTALRLTRRQSFELLSQCNVCQPFLSLVPLQNHRKSHCKTGCGRLSNLPQKNLTYRLSNGAATCSPALQVYSRAFAPESGVRSASLEANNLEIQ
jgi:hypothetical protein